MAVLKLINNSDHREEKNLCFVNASLQLLYSITEIRDFYKNEVYRDNPAQRFPASDELSRIFRTAGVYICCRTKKAHGKIS